MYLRRSASYFDLIMNVSSIKPVRKKNKMFNLPKVRSIVQQVSSGASIDSDQSSLDSTRWYQLSPIKHGTQKYDSDSDEDALRTIIKDMQAEIMYLKDRILQLEVIVNKLS